MGTMIKIFFLLVVQTHYGVAVDVINSKNASYRRNKIA